jgi:hypothetical protein
MSTPNKVFVNLPSSNNTLPTTNQTSNNIAISVIKTRSPLQPVFGGAQMAQTLVAPSEPIRTFPFGPLEQLSPRNYRLNGLITEYSEEKQIGKVLAFDAENHTKLFDFTSMILEKTYTPKVSDLVSVIFYRPSEMIFSDFQTDIPITIYLRLAPK